MKYWLFKSEPNVFSIEDLKNAKNKSSIWEGVRNFQARNFLRDEVLVDDMVMFYHSRVEPVGVVGIAKVIKAGYPDPFQWKSDSKYFDAKATKEKPIWYTVDIQFVEEFSRVVTLKELKGNPVFSKMMVVQPGSRLSIQPVERAHFERIQRMGREG